MRCFVFGLVLVLTPLAAGAARPFVIVIQRNTTCNNGEAGGVLSIGGEAVARTLELPWRNNESFVSRIPAGTYKGKVRWDGEKLSYGWRIELAPVEPDERKFVQLHIGRYPRNTTGCILVGTDLTGEGGTCALTDSVAAMKKVREAFEAASGNGVSSQPVDITVVVRD